MYIIRHTNLHIAFKRGREKHLWHRTMQIPRNISTYVYDYVWIQFFFFIKIRNKINYIYIGSTPLSMEEIVCRILFFFLSYTRVSFSQSEICVRSSCIRTIRTRTNSMVCGYVHSVQIIIYLYKIITTGNTIGFNVSSFFGICVLFDLTTI